MQNIRVVWKQLIIVLLGILGVLAVGAFGILTLRDNVLEGKRTLARHTVDLGTRLLAEYERREYAGEFNRAEAQQRAKERLRALGMGKTEYLWIIDPDYRVVMHPYLPHYEDRPFSDIVIPELGEVMTSIVDMIKREGEGFVSYPWPKPGSYDPVPKFSYVTIFKPWNWIVGAGVYVDDVRATVSGLAWIVGGVGALVLVFVLTGSFVLGRSITIPLSEVAAGLRRLSAGDMDVQVPESVRRDELGDLVRSMRAFHESLIDRERLLRELEDGNRVLRESEARFRDLADLLPETVFEIDPEGTLTYANQAAFRVFGLSEDTLANGVPLVELFAEGEHGRLRQMVRHTMAGEAVGATEFQARRKNGEHFSVLFRSVPVLRGRQVAGGRGVMFDISTRIEAEKREADLRDEIAHVGRLGTMGEMAAGFAHELNQPLAAINNYARGSLHRIEAGMVEAGMLRMPLEKIRDEAMRAGEVIRCIRDFVRKRKAERIIFRVEKVISDVEGLLGSEIRHGQIDFQIEIDDDLPPVLGDPVSIRQVLLNLVLNAIEVLDMSTGHDRLIAVSALRSGSSTVEISVADSGPGIRDDIHRKVFEPFFTTKETGTGMGLSICRTIVEAHGGTLSFETPTAGGTRFHFTLPVDADSEKNAA